MREATDDIHRTRQLIRNLSKCAAVAERHAIIDEGRVVWTGDTDALSRADDVVRRHLTLENA